MPQSKRQTVDASQLVFAGLPGTVLAQILQHLPQQQRFACAGVSRAFASAAAAGTVSIQCDRLAEAQRHSLQAWLRQHGRQVTAVTATHRPQDDSAPCESITKLQLPAAELQQLTGLELSGLWPSLSSKPQSPADDSDSPAASSHATPARMMPHLSKLRLARCTISEVSDLEQLTQLSGLTSLAMSHITLASAADAAGKLATGDALSGALPRLLQHLPRLAHLELDSVKADANIAVSSVAAASSSLTNLCVTAVTADEHQPEAHVPGSSISVARFELLQRLILRHADFDPAGLASLPQLWHLELFYCTMLPLAHQPDPEEPANTAKGITLLDALAGMQDLQHLSLRFLIHSSHLPSEVGMRLQQCFAEVQPQRLSALTMSSQLTCLEVSGEEWDAPLPLTAVQHMFPPGKQLPALQTLHIGFDNIGARYTCAAPFVTSGELRSMVTACPGLRTLNISGVVPVAGDEDLSALLQLPESCCSLCVAGVAFGDREAAIIGQLTQLTYLHWLDSPISDAGLRHLTALQELQHLHLEYNDELDGSAFVDYMGTPKLLAA